MHCTGFLLLGMTTFTPRTIENLHVHKLSLPHENLKLKSKMEIWAKKKKKKKK